MHITSKDLKRFSKQIILRKVGLSGQQKISSSKILIVGAGGLGCPLLLYLANTGVGNIGIVDNDKIEESNLNRQILFMPKDIGKYKVIQAKKVIRSINKNIKISTYKKRLNKNNIKDILNKFDIVCDCSDNFETRYLINDHCLKYKKILIAAAVSRFDGHIFSFNFKRKTPCLRCFMPEIPNVENNCESEGIISTLAGIAGTIQANEVINNILNKSTMKNKILVFNSFTSDFRKIKLFKNPKCIKECSKR